MKAAGRNWEKPSWVNGTVHAAPAEGEQSEEHH
jgi:hypothetical protein